LVDVVKFLLSNGADINTKNRRGYTVLHIAILQEQKETVQLLLENGADTTVSAKEGTCIQMAQRSPAVLAVLNDFINKSAGKSVASPSGINHSKSQSFLSPSKATAPPTKLARPLPVPPPKELKNSGHAMINPEALKLACYHGQITREASEILVTNFGGNCYLLRASSVRGCFAMTLFRQNEKEITHYLIYPRTNGGYSIQDCDDTGTYPNLTDLLAKSTILKGCSMVSATTTSSSNSTPSPSPSNSKMDAGKSFDSSQLKRQIQELQQLLVASSKELDDSVDKWNQQGKQKLKQSLVALSSHL